jgi:LacI family transcriptional regulator
MKATMKDVASLAGVGVGTVSRVINNVKVKEATKIKVLNAIEELNYVPDEYARGLKTNRTNTVALIIPTIWHPFFSEFAYYIEDTLSKRKYKLLICNADGSPDKEKEYIEMVKQSKVDGIIGITYSDIDKYVSSNIPFVSIDRHFSEQVSYVTADNFLGGQIAAQKLISNGCQKLAYIGGISPYPNETNNRKEGFISECHNLGFTVKKLIMTEPIENSEEQLAQFFSKNEDIDGIFAVNDFMALEVIKARNKQKKYAPQDYQIIGFDGVRMSDAQNYVISTIAQPIKEMAISSVEILLGIVLNNEKPKRVVLPVLFRDGGTTKKD